MAQALGFLFILSLGVTGLVNYTAFSLGQDGFDQVFEQPQYAVASDQLLVSAIE
ncbi:hypothetical protein O4H49_03920 [Kiloniella laminariae]|uniref:Uncharacterized protein n=1 Tax=Kiloniella laminariae TaxID=454162 RepID=A0ABT4LFM5_9PROT|nr:hypothetical protein [Kiloniella laminariae]MCZ4279911.1 hypothetical protein [Kiloniella laminariae]